MAQSRLAPRRSVHRHQRTTRAISVTLLKKLHGSNASSHADSDTDVGSLLEEENRYKDLRYDSATVLVTLPALNQDFGLGPTRTVLVKRKTKELLPPVVRKTLKSLPSLKTRKEGPLDASRRHAGLLEKRSKSLQLQVLQDRCLLDTKKRSLASQQTALETWEKECKYSALQRQRLSKKLGVPPESVLVSRPLTLPKLQHSGVKPQRDFSRSKPNRSGFVDYAFFLLPEKIGPEDDLTVSLKRSEKQLYTSPINMVRPALGEQPKFRDLCGRTLRASKKKEDLLLLYLKGKGASSMQNEDAAQVDMNSGDSFGTSLSISYGMSRSVSTRRCELYRCSPRLNSPYYVRYTCPAFKLDKYVYVWKQPCLHDIVEIGVMCCVDNRGWTTIRLANIGCCSLRYSWRLQPHVDHFNTGRYRVSPFTFDCSGGIILPEEKVSIAVHFLSHYPGSWSERWFLKTLPCLSHMKRGEIEVNLWGRALEVDVNLEKRRSLEKVMEMNYVQRMAERYTNDLLRLMPIRSDPYLIRENISPTQEGRGADDVAAFLKINPGLHYHSVPMISLMSAHAILWSQQSHSPKQVDSVEWTKTEELQEKAKEFSALFKTEQTSSRKSGQRSPAAVADDAVGKRPQTSPSSIRRHSSLTGERSRFGRRKRTSHQASGPLDSSARYSLMELSRLPRAEIDARKIYHEVKHLTEDGVDKELILKNINQAMMAMSLRPFGPHVQHYKHLIVREALVLLFDSIDMAEWKLRQCLDLHNDPRFLLLTSFCQAPTKVSDWKRKFTIRNPKMVFISHLKKAVQSEVSLVKEPEESIQWDEWAPRLWRENLRLIIYTNLASTLESLLPILEYGGYWIIPQLRKQKIINLPKLNHL